MSSWRFWRCFPNFLCTNQIKTRRSLTHASGEGKHGLIIDIIDIIENSTHMMAECNRERLLRGSPYGSLQDARKRSRNTICVNVILIISLYLGQAEVRMWRSRVPCASDLHACPTLLPYGQGQGQGQGPGPGWHRQRLKEEEDMMGRTEGM